ncbi:MAG: hypothetical protein OMM_10883 [Candidatus Magnetoglobus multicellularis str. Araruama]|uniref:Uncharacterized protein n=1 Tax=Candidatus Magnetoglobus multicellularis str. Araruama TaxID=890399 RepID=A0A1V1P018_9BACT|nr:MAG: hypothetical protein OMM_10883 [Candidatus Magnetoglobus multicellularis str. Araruama]
MIIVDEPYSEEVICNAVLKWLRDRNFEFKVKMISVETSRCTGMLKSLKEQIENLNEEESIPHEEFMKEMDLLDLQTQAEQVDHLKINKSVLLQRISWIACALC